MATSVKHIFKNKTDFKVTGNILIECEGERFFGPGRAELLELIDKTGSLNQAARQMDMSYKKAWEMVSHLNAQSAKPLVILKTGGEKGGGSVITAEAKELIAYYKLLRKRFQSFLEKETKRLYL
jgi:molybdate transport system regulatory protein